MSRSPEELVDIASRAVSNCYCPYSQYHVAAVIEDSRGVCHTGVNVENASYGLTVCAERIAVFTAVSSGSTEFRKILIHSPDGKPYPCGACREVLSEFCPPDFPVLISYNGQIDRVTIGELLPHRFLEPKES